MKAAVYRRYGPPEVLKIEDVEKPVPGGGEVLVRVRAASINDWDWGLLQDKSFVTRMMNGLFRPKCRIPGCDVAGRVEAVGAKVGSLRPGDEVFGDLSGSGFGAFAEYVCAPESSLARKPAGMSFEQAAAIPQAGMLAVQGLVDVGRVRPGQTILLNGAGGGVGTFAVQLAKLHGVEVTAVDSAGKLDTLRVLGADYVIDYTKQDFTKAGKRYDLILDTKTDRPPRAYARVLNPDGLYVTVGGELSRVFRLLIQGRLTSRINGRRMRVVILKPNKDLGLIIDLFQSGEVRPVIDGIYPLAGIVKAFRRFGAASHIGKIIVTMG